MENNNNTEFENTSFEINTYQIYWLLKENWDDENKRYPRLFYDKIKEAIAFTFRENKYQSHVDLKDDLIAFEGYIFRRYPMHENKAKEEGSFPIGRYMVFYRGIVLNDLDYLDYIAEINKENNDLEKFLAPFALFILDEEICSITPNNLYYHLFFALQLASIDIMKIDIFLDYQLSYNFNSDISIFYSYLDKIIIGYKEYFWDSRIELIQKYQHRKPQTVPTEKVTNTYNELTIRKKVLAMLFMLEAAGMNNIDKTIIADFIKLITGKEDGQKTTNGNIYKVVKNWYSTTDRKRIEDLQFLREQFEKLQIQQVIERINKDMK